MTKTYQFTQPLTPFEWGALPRAFEAGDTVDRFSGHDYGCVNDDYRIGGVKSVACTIDGKAFFTVPAEVLAEA